MRSILTSTILILAAASILSAQPSTPPSITPITPEPTAGAGCTASSITDRQYTANGHLYSCSGGVWIGVGGTVSGTPVGTSGMTSGNCVQATGTSTIGTTSSACGSPPIPTGTQFAIQANEGTGATLHDTSGNGHDCTLSGTYSWLNNILTLGGGSALCPAAALNGAETITVLLSPSYGISHGSNQNISYGSAWGVDTTYTLNLPLYMPGGGAFFQNNAAVLVGTADKYQGPVSITIVLGGSPAMYINGSPIVTTVMNSGAPSSITASTNAFLGTINGISPGFQGEFLGLYAWSSTRTPAQLAQDQAYYQYAFRAVGLTQGFDPTDYTKACLVWDGDSIISNGLQSFQFNSSAPNYANQILGDQWNVWNVALSGALQSTLATQFAAKVAPLFASCNSGTKIVYDNAGINDLHNGNTAAQLETSTSSYISSAHALGLKVVMATILPSGWLSGASETARQTYNAWLVSNWLAGTGADWISDRAGDPLMGNPAALTVNSFEYYNNDGGPTHPTAVGNSIVAVDDALAIISASGRNVNPIWVQRQTPFWALTANASTTHTTSILQLGPNQKVCGATYRTTTGFAGSGIATVTASLGDSGGSATSYASAQSITSATNFDPGALTFVSSNGLVQESFISSAGNLSALTAGNENMQLCLVIQ